MRQQNRNNASKIGKRLWNVGQNKSRRPTLLGFHVGEVSRGGFMPKDSVIDDVWIVGSMRSGKSRVMLPGGSNTIEETEQ